MTKKRLEELRQKFQSNEANTQDVGEILIEFFLSFSEHIKEIKKEITNIKDEQEKIYTELQKLNNPVYTIIEGYNDDMDELSEESEEIEEN